MAYHFDERALICQFAKDNADVPELEVNIYFHFTCVGNNILIPKYPKVLGGVTW